MTNEIEKTKEDAQPISRAETGHKKIFKSLKDRIKSWYPDQEVTDYELTEVLENIVHFYTLGAKVAYQHRKRAQNKQKG